MITVAGTVQINPEHRAEVVQAALGMAQTTQSEAGCITYKFYADLEDPNTFLIFEIWETDEALAQHFQTDHMKTFQQQLPKFVAGPMDIRHYTDLLFQACREINHPGYRTAPLERG